MASSTLAPRDQLTRDTAKSAASNLDLQITVHDLPFEGVLGNGLDKDFGPG